MTDDRYAYLALIVPPIATGIATYLVTVRRLKAERKATMSEVVDAYRQLWLDEKEDHDDEGR